MDDPELNPDAPVASPGTWSRPGTDAGSRTESLTRDEPAWELRPPVYVLRVPGLRDRWIRGGGLVIGSGPEAGLVLRDRAVSARHLSLRPRGGDLELRDLGSRNGSWVDGVRVTEARLRGPARLRLGRTDLQLTYAPGERGDGGLPVGPPTPGTLVAASPEMTAVLAEVDRLSRLPWPVLVLGETGVGKEQIARALHRRSPRAEGPFVPINAGGLPRDLVESELFGHERGAFTGAHRAHRGVFAQADGGTLFLDEIGELDLALQARLLRVLETGEVRRVGGERPAQVDVRLVTATHRALPGLVRAGRFRADLYYRIARTVVTIPPLRQRPADVAALARHFLAGIAEDVGPRALTPAALAVLEAHPWPGNARELRNVLSMAAAASGALRVDAPAVRAALLRMPDGDASEDPGPAELSRALALHGGNRAAAARSLGIPRSTFRDRLARWGPT